MTTRRNHQPVPRLLRSGLTGRVYIVTKYKVTGQHPTEGYDLIEAIEKHDVTEDFNRLAAAVGAEE